MPKIEKVKECHVIKHCMVGKPTKYNKKVNIPLLIKCFAKGESIRQYCAKALITERTFYNWLKEYKEFKYCYDIALNLAADYWEKLPIENPDFNFPYLQAVLRNRFGFGKSKLNLKDKKKAIEILDAIREGLTDQDINTNDLKALIEFATAIHQLKENTEDQGEKERSIQECIEIANKLLPASNILELELENRRLKKQLAEAGNA